MYHTLLFSLIFSLILILPAQGHSQNPAAYVHVSNWTNFADFTVQNSHRPILQEKGVTFETETEIAMTFQILVTPAGKVKFVRPPRCAAALNEYRLGGTDALYNFTFASVDDSLGEQWLTVEMRVRPDGATLQAQ